MDFLSLVLLLSILLWTCFHLLSLQRRRHTNLPPGPPPFPVIGNMLQLGKKPHQSLAQFAKTHGPIMHFKFGSMDTVVVSSPELAKQVLQKHDRVLSSRHMPAVTSAHNHKEFSVVWLPANARWLTLRKILKEHLFSLQRLDASQGLRREKLQKLRDYVDECCGGGGRVVDISDAVATTSMNLISASLFSVDFAQFGSDSPQEFKELVHNFMKAAGTPNIADCFPVLKRIDPQGLTEKTERHCTQLFRTFDDIIDARLKSADSNVGSTDLLNSLLEINRKNESELSRNDILHLLLDLFVAGIDTTTTTVGWAMAEVIRNPDVMAKAKQELETIVGAEQQVQESDITRLPYLQAVLKETFRLHPAGPLLVPHQANADTQINGFVIPREAQVLVNVWAIGRNPNTWSDPDRFNPGRFLESKTNFKGQDFELIPFGSGRRICPGLPLAYRMVHLMVASLIHGYEWRLPGGIKPQELNMDEMFEFSLQRAVPLMAIPVKL